MSRQRIQWMPDSISSGDHGMLPRRPAGGRTHFSIIFSTGQTAMNKCLTSLSTIAAVLLCVAASEIPAAGQGLPMSGRALSAGGAHTIGVNSAGQIVAWGDATFSTPVPAGSDFFAVSAGAEHSMALRSDGTVVAWGFEEPVDPDGRTEVPTGLANVVAISAGAAHSLALQANGAVVSWGETGDAQVPTPGDLPPAVAISAGGTHSVAILHDGTVQVWGGLANDETGTAPTILSDSASPGFQESVDISSGNRHSLALRADGTIVGWGVGAQMTEAPASAVAISAGADHSLALQTDGSVAAWGDGVAAVAPTTNSDFVYVDAGGSHNYGVRITGEIVSWGNNSSGQGTTPLGFTLPTQTTWATGTSGDYLNSHKWQQGIPSTTLSNANFDASGTYTVNFGNDANAMGLNVSTGELTFDLNANDYTVVNVVDVDSSGTFGIVDGTVAAASVSNAGLINVASGGELAATGTISNTGEIINNGTLTGTVSTTGAGILSGNGNLVGTLTISDGGTLAPGNSVGLMTGTNMVFGPGGNFEFEINDATGVAGGPAGWDKQTLTGTLNITATSGNPFTVDVSSLSGTVAGNAANFDPLTDYSWDFVTADGGITGFAANLFAITTSSFTNPTTGTFSISQTGNTLFVNYATAVPEPSSLALLGAAGLGFAGYRRRRQRKAQAATADAGDAQATAATPADAL